MRYRRLRPGDREWPRAEAPRRRERRDPDVLVEAAGLGAVHAEEQEDLEAGGDPARDRLHLRPAVGAGEPPGDGAVRRGGRAGVAAVRRGAAAAGAAPAAGPARRAQHHPPQHTNHPGAQKSDGEFLSLCQFPIFLLFVRLISKLKTMVLWVQVLPLYSYVYCTYLSL